MSMWQDPFRDVNRYQKPLAQRCEQLLNGISYTPICTFTTNNLYRNKNDGIIKTGLDFPGPFLPDGTIKPGPTVAWGLAKVTDFNDRRVTGRARNGTYRAKELPNGKTEFYVAYPLERRDPSTGLLTFSGTPDSRWEPTIDPRLAALETYPEEISSLAKNIQAEQAKDFARSFPYTLNVNGEYIPLDTKAYCENVADCFLQMMEQNPEFNLQ